MNFDILKLPTELTRNEISEIFKMASGFSFPSYCINEFDITDDEFFNVTVNCKTTGYTMQIENDYSILIKNSLAPIQSMHVIGVVEALLKNKIISVK